MHDKQTVEIKTEEEMVTQLKLLLDNGYDVAISKNDNLLGCVSYSLAYKKTKNGGIKNA